MNLSPHSSGDIYLDSPRTMSRKAVAKSMRNQGLVARPKRRFVVTTDSTHGRRAPKNLVARDFSPAAPNRVWVADTTYLPTQVGFIYLVVVLDLFANHVVDGAHR